MTAVLHPGVYVQEVPSGARSIEGVPTSTTIFVGETERGPLAATKVKGISDYEREFGGYYRPDTAAASGSVPVAMRYAMDAFFSNGGTTAYVLRAASTSGTAQRAEASPAIAAATPGAWGNDLYAVFFSLPPTATDSFRVAVYYRNRRTAKDELVEDWPSLTQDASSEQYAVDVLKRSNYIRWVEGGTLPAAVDATLGAGVSAADLDLTTAATAKLAGGVGGDAAFGWATPATVFGLLSELDGVDDAALIAAAPDLWVQSPVVTTNVGAVYEGFRNYIDNRPKLDLFLVADIAAHTAAATTATTNAVAAVDATTFNRTTMSAVYWPHVRVVDPIGKGARPVKTLPPSAFIAGLYSRTDASRGVWKAPAGVDVLVGGIAEVDVEVLDKHQDDLNPKAINAIRAIPGAGVVVWGTRTLRPDTEWRYVPVRRTAMFLRKSIYNGIQWAVFEPNDEDLWASLRATIGAFMETQFQRGAFAGSSSRDAYFVKCDAETTSAIDQANGIVNVLVGFAPLRPAEFVIVKLSQKTASAA